MLQTLFIFCVCINKCVPADLSPGKITETLPPCVGYENQWQMTIWVFSPTFVQTPVVASQSVRIDTFWALFSQFTATLVLVAHFTMVM